MQDNTFTMLLIQKRTTEYQKASRTVKGQILTQLETDTGRSRKSLIRTLKSQQREHKAGPGRPKKYEQQTINLLELVWSFNDYIAAERFHSEIKSTLIDLADSNLLTNYDQGTKNLVEYIPLGSLKLLLRRIVKPRVKFGCSGSTNLKKQIPIRTGFKSNLKSGFLAVDFVEHSGGDGGGKFARTLCLTDQKTTWLVRRACLGKDRAAVESACSKAIESVPYLIKGLHSDNEPNLLYTSLRYKAQSENFMVTRSRPFHKEDNGHVEQKNGDKVRGLVGYHRYDTALQVEVLNKLYQIDDQFQNHFIPSVRLISKEYDELGKLTRKEYDLPQSAYKRVMADPDIPARKKLLLCQEHKQLNRVQLKTERDNLLKELINAR